MIEGCGEAEDSEHERRSSPLTAEAVSLKLHGKAWCSMLDRPIISLAVWLSKPVGFLTTCFTVAAGLGSGALLSFNDHWALVFNLFLSIAAMLLAGVILVAGARDTAAIQIKLDELIRAVADTDERLIGIEDRSAEELELLRQTRRHRRLIYRKHRAAVIALSRRVPYEAASGSTESGNGQG